MAELVHEGPTGEVHAGAEVGGKVDDSRRKLLLGATVFIGAVGAGFTAVPFIESWLPSARALALGLPTEVDLSKIEPGQMIVTEWRRNPIYVVHRTPQLMALLGGHDELLKDPGSKESTQPDYCNNAMRSRNAQWYVSIGTCTHLGCLPDAKFDPRDPELGSYWPGGWLCPCHGSRYDMSGRVFDGSPAPLNLNIMPYAFASSTKLVVGVDDAAQGSKNS
ncbi:MAG: ubiquinol-cytochrome c reductase iron-sulfur subunit [Steroidobacteraceae bacterium]